MPEGPGRGVREGLVERHVKLQERLDDPEKRWKFRAEDLQDRALWDDYQRAYEDALSSPV